jgi:hypothetical protein
MKYHKVPSYYVTLLVVSDVLCILFSNKKMLQLQSCDMLQVSADSMKAVTTECIHFCGGIYSTLTLNVACGQGKVEVIW